MNASATVYSQYTTISSSSRPEFITSVQFRHILHATRERFVESVRQRSFASVRSENVNGHKVMTIDDVVIVAILHIQYYYCAFSILYSTQITLSNAAIYRRTVIAEHDDESAQRWNAIGLSGS